MLAARQLGVSWSMTAHAGDIYGNRALRDKADSSSFVRVVSEVGRSAMLALSVPLDRVRLIHLGVEVPESPCLSVAERRPVTTGVCAASLIPRKGHEYLIRAVARLRREGLRVEFDLAGEGPERASLSALANQLGVGAQFHFLGHVPRRDLLDRYERCAYDLMVLPSSGVGSAAEGVPVSLMEAMASGIPTVATDSGSVYELIHRDSGLLVPPGDDQALADALRRLITSPEARAAASRSGRDIILSDFNALRNGARLASTIREASVVD
jgi:glycosyltransferase involved in cell wall biosynthesis